MARRDYGEHERDMRYDRSIRDSRESRQEQDPRDRLAERERHFRDRPDEREVHPRGRLDELELRHRDRPDERELRHRDRPDERGLFHQEPLDERELRRIETRDPDRMDYTRDGRSDLRAIREFRSKPNDYFLPGEDINREVIQADICRYLGSDATVRPYTHQDGRQGYLIKAYRAPTTAMIATLKQDSKRFENEVAQRRRQSGQPATSATLDERERAGRLDLPQGRYAGHRMDTIMDDYEDDDRGTGRGYRDQDARMDTRMDPRQGPGRDSRIEPRIDSRINPRRDSRTDSGQYPRVDPRIDPQMDIKMDPRQEPQIESRIDRRIEPRINPRRDSRTNPGQYPRVDSRMDTRMDPMQDIMQARGETLPRSRVYSEVSSYTASSRSRDDSGYYSYASSRAHSVLGPSTTPPLPDKGGQFTSAGAEPISTSALSDLVPAHRDPRHESSKIGPRKGAGHPGWGDTPNFRERSPDT